MSEKLEPIGSAVKIASGDAFEEGEGVNFRLKYGEDEYGITLTNDEMDRVLKGGMERILGNQALGGFDYRLYLGDGELPLFVGPRSIEIPSGAEGYHDVAMATSIVSEAISYPREQRGILLANRQGWNGSWEFDRYDLQPELREPEPCESFIV